MNEEKDVVETEVVDAQTSPDQDVLDGLMSKQIAGTKVYLRRAITFGIFFVLSIAAFVAMIVLRNTVLQQGWVTGMAVIFGVLAFVTGISFYLFFRLYRMIKKTQDLVKQTADMSEEQVMDILHGMMGQNSPDYTAIENEPIDVKTDENE